MGYWAPMLPPAVSTPTGICHFHLLDISNQVCGGVRATTQVLHRNSGRNDIRHFVQQAADVYRQMAAVNIIRRVLSRGRLKNC